MVGQPGHYLLWISIAGINLGKPEHFKHNYLAALISGFHVPVMEFPLRNRKEILKLGGLDFENKNRQSSVGQQMNTNPSYVLPPYIMSGIRCQEILLKTSDDRELANAVENGCKMMLERTAGRGFPLLFEDFGYCPEPTSISVVAAVRRVVGATPLIYTGSGQKKN